MESNSKALRPFGSTTAIGSVNRTREIRDAIALELETNPDLWATVEPIITPQGTTGSVQFDHAIAADRVLEAVTAIHRYNLKHREVWYHIEAVLRGRGYKLSKGYVVGHRDDDDVPQEQSYTAPEATAQTVQ